jgi:CBS domain-containing protein
MSIAYSSITILTSEEARWKGRPLHDAVVNLVRGRKIAARCHVTRGIAGCYENGEVATHTIVDLSANLPLEIRIVLPAAEAETLLADLEPMVGEGMILVEEAHIRSHRTAKRLFPRWMRVRDAMTASPASVTAATPVVEVVRLLLRADFNGVPVVDPTGAVQGIITETDLIARGGMPLRLGLLAELEAPVADPGLVAFEALTAGDVMTPDPVTVQGDEPLERAGDRMAERDLKRLPVVDEAGHLVGMLSRVDVLRTVAHTSPDWQAFPEHIEISGEQQAVRTLAAHGTPAVVAGATLAEVLDALEAAGAQRAAVIDEEGLLLGIVSDRDVLRVLQGRGEAESVLARWSHLGRGHGDRSSLAGVDASDVMTTRLVTASEDAPVEEAIRLMTTHGLKRLPVVDDEGHYMGMLSRDALLRAGLRT